MLKRSTDNTNQVEQMNREEQGNQKRKRQFGLVKRGLNKHWVDDDSI